MKQDGALDHSLSLISKALYFAAYKHRNQRRKDQAASPYINHPILLMSILADEAKICDPNVLIGALLHDTVEDTDTTPAEIEKLFGKIVRQIVEEVTDDRGLPRSERKALQIAHAPNLSTEAAMIKIADKIANLRDMNVSPPVHWSEERKKDYLLWATEVVSRIKNPHPKLLVIFQKTISTFS